MLEAGSTDLTQPHAFRRQSICRLAEPNCAGCGGGGSGHATFSAGGYAEQLQKAAGLLWLQTTNYRLRLRMYVDACLD